MGMEEVVVVVLPTLFQLLLKLCVICFAFRVQGSTVFSGIPPIEATPGPVQQRWPFTSNAPSSEPQPNGSNLPPPLASPPQISALVPQAIIGFVPSYSQSPPIAATPSSRAPPPLIFLDHAPSLPPSIPVISPTYNTAHEPPKPPNAHRRETPVRKKAVSMPNVPATAPSRQLPPNATSIQPSVPEASSPRTHQNNRSVNEAPIPKSIAPVASPPRKSEENQPAVHPIAPATTPSISPIPDVSPIGAMPQNSSGIHPIGPGESPSMMPGPDVSHPSAPPPRIDQKKDGIPVAAPPDETHKSSPHLNHSPTKGPDVSHPSAPPPRIDQKKDGIPVAAPPDETHKSSPHLNHSPTKGSAAAPSTHGVTRHSNDSIPPPKYTPNKVYHSPVPSPSIPFHTQSHERGKITGPAPSSSYQAFPPSSKQQGPVIPPIPPTIRHQNYAPPPLSPVSASHYRSPKPVTIISPAPSPSPTIASVPGLSPEVSPSWSSTRTPKMPLQSPFQALPPPPPNEDCSAIVCTEPYANTPPGSPCGCVVPMQVGLSLSVALYTFFPLVSELAQEIAAGVFMKQSQVRIIGANSASQQPEKTVVLIDLVPLGETFDNTTAFLTYQRFWHKEVVINPALFGDYEVLYVRYLGLPPSPPLASSGSTIIDDGPYSGNSNDARRIKPLGVDVQKGKHKNGLGGGMIAIIAVSGSMALVLCSAVAWVLLYRQRDHVSQPAAVVQPLPPSVAKPSGATASMVGSALSSVSLSFGSSIPTYTGSAKTFGISDMERATNNFDASRILGEGGFGRVYSGVLEDGTKVAVKVLKRDDQQGGREFLAEVEMLSRLHHRNLVKLIGICTEERSRCLVYELIPNGSVESHLHGVDKQSAPLDWDARIKIALGAARGLAYLHEDSSPRVIHRDFKSSNILLEHDFTAKVSDFGLARTAFDEENRHISTRVMGTFGYVAPEYAMTGHLLVKSDVYSYGVVLLELLTGRKPVDMSQQPGQENLVAWARPLLTSKEGLEVIIDQSLGPDVPFDSVAKVAAIASMCVQPEVSHRPFMGEVVQALKLVCNECDESKEVDSRSSSQDLSVDVNAGVSAGSGHLLDPFENHALVPNYNSELDIETGLSMSDFFSTSVRFETEASGSLRRSSSSGPLRTGRDRELWRRMRLRGESTSEHRAIFGLWPGSN